jgi:hypothetical protein
VVITLLCFKGKRTGDIGELGEIAAFGRINDYCLTLKRRLQKQDMPGKHCFLLLNSIKPAFVHICDAFTIELSKNTTFQ